MTVLSNSRLKIHLDFGEGESPILLGECLWFSEKNVAAFQWSEQALTLPYRLSPLHMPLQKAVVLAKRDPFGGLHGLFSDSIPDGFGLRMMNNSFKSSGRSLDSVTPVHRLAWVGSRGLGALTYGPAIGPVESKELMDISALGLHAARADVDNFAEIPIAAIKAGGSAHGARPKFWASVHKDGKTVILGDSLQTPKNFTQCLVKFAPARGDRNEPFFEAACLQLANSHGVRAAKARLLLHPNGAALAVERFDRLPGGGRKFTQSLAAILNDDFRFPKLDYDHIFQVSQALTIQPEAERIYRQACFNVALSMKDDHSKNFAFLMDKNGKWELSPAFDLCPNDGPSGWQTMSVSGVAQSIERTHLLKFAQRMGLTESVAKDGLDQALSAANQFAPLSNSLGAQKNATNRWTRTFKEIEKRLTVALVPANRSTLNRKASQSTIQNPVDAEVCPDCKNVPCTCGGDGRSGTSRPQG
jgi:serine/threonine-protein kinase HipA